MASFTDFEIDLLNHIGCVPSMMMPNSWILVGGLEDLCNFHKVKATVEAFFYFFQINSPNKGSWFYLQASGHGSNAKKLFRDLKDPLKDWKKDFYLVRSRQGCQPSWWLREDGTPLFPTKWVEPFEAVPRTVSALAPGSATKYGSELSAQGATIVEVTERRQSDSASGACEEPKADASIISPPGLKKEQIYLAAENELELLRPEAASLRSNEQLLKVQLEGAKKELQVWKDRSTAQDDEIKALSLLKQFQEATRENIKLRNALDEEKETVKALTNDCSGAMEWGWGNCLDQVRFFNPQVELELRHELSPDDMIVAAGAEEVKDAPANEVMELQESEGGPLAEPTGAEPEIAEPKPATSGEEFANSILAY
ncbi:uncharacterized protein G2W53_029274 [Senna tora]|uniref:Uncharacterized protein n=1 Tax=Senna tora TaxID=362788 RepID=A0A834T4A9_9FABA|nr:uncharacterized protein G2W53_029274 [Senna tora]